MTRRTLLKSIAALLAAPLLPQRRPPRIRPGQIVDFPLGYELGRARPLPPRAVYETTAGADLDAYVPVYFGHAYPLEVHGWTTPISLPAGPSGPPSGTSRPIPARSCPTG